MGCQFEPQGAALKAIHETYASKGVLVCGLDRMEHPYDVEDYIRHFGLNFPVFVDLNEDSPAKCGGPLGSVTILGRNLVPAKIAGKAYCDPLEAKSALDKLIAEGGGAQEKAPLASEAPPPSKAETPPAPKITQPNWSEPAPLGVGRYPRIVGFGTNRALCVWVAGEVPAQRLEFATFDGNHWGPAKRIPTGDDAHAPALDVSAAGRPIIAWSQKDAGGYRVYWNSLVGPDWGEPAAVSPSGNNAFRPDVFCRPSGETVLSWYAWKTVRLRDYPRAWWRSIYVTQMSDGRPGPIRELAELQRGSDDCWDPVCTGTEAELQVSWLRDENPPRLFFSALGRSGWSRLEPLVRVRAGPGAYCRVQSASPVRGPGRRSGLVFEFMSSGEAPPLHGGTHVYCQRLHQEGLTNLVTVSSGPGRHLAPVAVETTSRTQVVFWWRLSPNKAPATIHLRELDGAGRGAAGVVLVEGHCSNLYPAAALGAEGSLWLAWQASRADDSPSIYAARRTNRAP